MIDPNAPAFPVEYENGMAEIKTLGLTKREYFAAQAIAVVNWHGLLHHTGVTPEIIADEAVGIADALIAKLNDTSSVRS
jgi:hypothetical protein